MAKKMIFVDNIWPNFIGYGSVSVAVFASAIGRIGLAAALHTAGAVAASAVVYADSASVSDATYFASGILSGAPDSGGAYLSTPGSSSGIAKLGSIVWNFSGGLTVDAGIDLVLHEILPSANEIFALSVSADGVLFENLGTYSTQTLEFDLDGLLTDPFYFVRVTNASYTNAPDFDAAEGRYAYKAQDPVSPPPAIPLPASLPLGLMAVASLLLLRRRRPEARR